MASRRPRRSRIYDSNFNMGESYYKSAIDRLDEKYSTGSRASSLLKQWVLCRKCGNFGATAIFEYYWDGTSINRFSFTLNFVNLVQRLLMICIGKYFELMVVDVGPTCEFTLWISQSMILLVFWTSHQVSRNSGNSNIF